MDPDQNNQNGQNPQTPGDDSMGGGTPSVPTPIPEPTPEPEQAPADEAPQGGGMGDAPQEGVGDAPLSPPTPTIGDNSGGDQGNPTS